MAKRPLSPTWLVAGAASLTLGCSRGLHSSFGVLYVALLEAFGWSRGLTAAVYSVNVLVDAVVSPLVGHLLDRYGPKRVAATGCLLLSLGFLLSSRIGSLWQFYLFFGLVVALGYSFTGMVPHVVLVSQWFLSNRTTALGVVYAGTGVGILLLAPLTQWLISTWGWARALQVLAASVFIILLPLVLGFYRRGPYAGLAQESTESKNEWTARLALKSVQFWSLFFARILAASGTTVIVTHQVAHVVDIGYSGLFAASVFGVVGITSTLGRMVFGLIADIFSKQAAYTANIVTTLVGVGALMSAHDTSRPWLLYVYVIFFGIGFGSRAVIFSALTADIFSGKRFGAIYGYYAISVGVGGALGSWLGGVFYDLTGSYLVSFIFSATLLAVSDVCVWLASLKWISSFDRRLWPQQK